MKRPSSYIRLCTAGIAASLSLGVIHPALAFPLPLKPIKAAPVAQAQKQQQQTVVLAVDGFSYNAFLQAQKMGLFKEFTSAGAHVSPFPSMTDLSWSTITHTSELFGAAGRIKSVEATYFDESSQSVQGDPRDYYRRLAFPKYYMGAFDAFFNPYVEALMYFPTEEVPKLEIKSVVDDLISAKQKQFMTGYVGAVDSTAHTQLNRLYPVIKTLDTEVSRLIKSYKDKGQDVEIILVSDHGNVGSFKEGEKEQEMVGVEVGKTVERAGLNFVQQLKTDKDVAMPLLALGTWAPVYLKSRKQMRPLIEEFRKESWFDMAVFVNKNNDTETLMTVITSLGEAKVQYDKKNDLYYYFPQSGNPLQIAQQYVSTQASPKAMDAKAAFTASLGTSYPDALFRLIESASERNFDFPDFILTLKDGQFIQNSLGAFTKMYRTHGSLSAASSFGLIASTKRKVPGQIRSKDILSFIGIDPKDLFGDTLRKHNTSDRLALNEVISNAKLGIRTDAKDLGQKRIFRHISKFVADTRPYFQVSEMKSFMEAFKFDPFKVQSAQGLSPMNFDVSKFDVQSMITPEDIGAVTDAVLSSGSPEKLLQDPRIARVKERVGLLKDQKTANLDAQHIDLTAGGGVIDQIKQFVLPAKRAVMKMYQLPYLLENSIVIQEKPYLPETRDLIFAREWINKKQQANSQIDVLRSAAQTLLKETIKEADLEGRIYPTPLTKIYNQKLDDQTTIVYVPGIYNSIFDKEIFSLGLNALSDEMGLRVIQPPVEATCGSEINGDIILNYLQKDIKDRLARGHKAPRYLFLSYSKGAVDTLHAFVKSPNFISSYVKGLVSIAAPLHGSSILNTTDLPFALVSALVENSSPEICQTEKTAAKSITPTAMDAFWRKNERSLIGLTRYFSITFESSPEDSHIFMKATKLIGQFDEDNDGVVTVSSSKFPDKLMAVDLGTIHADHLAGILSSRFNQKAFMKGVVNTMAEMNISNDRDNLTWNDTLILNEANRNKYSDGTYYRMMQLGLVQQFSVQTEKRITYIPFANSYDLNQKLLPAIHDPADSYETKVKLPQSQLKYDPYAVLDVAKLTDVMAGIKVNPATPQNMPDGIRMDYNHTNMVHFRMDHQFNYESRSPGGLDDNKDFGYVSAEFNGEKNWALMKSANNSIRMTTLAYRFSPLDFPNMNLKLAVTKDVVGADPVKGKTGKDDSAFQVWFTIRDGHANGDRTVIDPKNDKVILFGYYWGGPVPGETRKAGTIYENWYSNKNIVVATLPYAKQLLLNDQDMLGKVQDYQRNLAVDLKRAFPEKNIDDLEIVAITIQHDSNDTASSSEAYFRSLDFTK
ncbi:MAG: alkaline phosphatase family protein [Bdellovibrio sp.]|nr:alkaline phosphatase family protein [Bdellovibrio sp.]